ncbi:Uncharacterized membrane protein YgdD, TMEM256/DUF423 family [Flaviramulus basaltis]|uniref:Uncharacterized membrane protein YgdD, TMEM256/DUF423 family n=1 Tax=Flaviramulus basaltis TaxID=369401 RepID=A0A1K2IBB4_9FLAO|nr:DUF423 domain-containing protein [Flaviramulus basaltis]SFZ89600.1 Uncharacterized membrane protein YgdD, TMEM256/DUF423 family [Flaviramulus basaltis]
MNKKILITAALLGIISIVLGAFGAHGLKQLITAEAIQTFETGVRYQMYHAVFLLFVGSTALINEKTKKMVYYLTLIGVIFFSGSIYGLATNSLTSFNFKIIGFITPIGGLLLILAWVFILIDFLKMKENK